jgi:hypothetical protein
MWMTSAVRQIASLWLAGLATCLVFSVACSGDTASSTRVLASASPSAAASDSEDDPGAPSPATTASLPPATGQQCTDPHAQVYSPDRLQLLAACATVTGTVVVIRTEWDGDLHILLRLDAGEDKFINAKNVSGEEGDLVLEPVCVHTPTQADAISACTGYLNPLPIPAVGTDVSVTGPWMLDLDRGWLEIHPVFAFSGVGAPAPAATPTPTAAPATARPSAELSVSITAASYGYVAAHTLPGATCTAGAQLPSGNYSEAQGLQVSATAGADGDVAWSYGTTSRTTKGTGSYTVTCTLSGQTATATAPFTVS